MAMQSWIRKGQCSSCSSCAFEHEPIKKGKGKGRLRSLSPTSSPHRNSKGDGKGVDDASATGHTTIDWQKSVRKKRAACSVQASRKGSCRRSRWACSRMCKIPSSSRMQGRVGDTCVCKHTAESAATIAILGTADDERQMQLQKIQSDDKTQYRVFISQNQQNPKLRPSKKDLSNGL